MRVHLRVLAIVVLLTMAAQAAPKSSARIRTRPSAPSRPCVAGVYPLGLEAGRDGQLVIPPAASSRKRLPLMVFLHGAGHGSQEGLEALRADAEREGFLLLVPESRGVTWDAIRGSFGPDIDFLSRSLGHVFQQCPVDRGHITLAGFSDGGSYALSVGLANGDLFSRIIAFSPGFVIPAEAIGRPRIFVAHGTRDRILPIEQASRRIVEGLQSSGYSVVFREFDGPHAMSREIISQAVRWSR